MQTLLGPILFIRDGAPENILFGIVLVLLLSLGVGQTFLRPLRLWRLGLAILSGTLWLIAGELGAGIGC